MKIGYSMTSDVRVMNPDETVRAAAEVMANMDIGLLPVSENDRLVGMISDRDIAVRGVAAGMGPNTRIRDVMTYDVKYCFDDQDIDDVLENMADLQVRRLPVLDRAKRLIGIVSLGDLARRGSLTGMALAGISRPGGEHTQSM
jgi:CBS domain-containing protein